MKIISWLATIGMLIYCFIDAVDVSKANVITFTGFDAYYVIAFFMMVVLSILLSTKKQES